MLNTRIYRPNDGVSGGRAFDQIHLKGEIPIFAPRASGWALAPSVRSTRGWAAIIITKTSYASRSKHARNFIMLVMGYDKLLILQVVQQGSKM